MGERRPIARSPPPAEDESWLTEFAQMLAHRYNGEHGRRAVTLFSVWNEPNLGLFPCRSSVTGRS